MRSLTPPDARGPMWPDRSEESLGLPRTRTRWHPGGPGNSAGSGHILLLVATPVARWGTFVIFETPRRRLRLTSDVSTAPRCFDGSRPAMVSMMIMLQPSSKRAMIAFCISSSRSERVRIAALSPVAMRDTTSLSNPCRCPVWGHRAGVVWLPADREARM